MKNKARHIELLAPARDADIAVEAILHGADAVYMGPSSHGARALAGNSTGDIARVADFAHQFGARVYATVNTLVYDDELKQVEQLIGDLYRAGVDALIVQDLGILRLDIPPIALHASTQCDLRTPEKARFLAAMGFSQLVMARELTLDEISAIHSIVPKTPLEAFVHGALCVSYSGRCQVSQCLKNRSANRGACAQICRLSYDLEDGGGNAIIRNKHLLSLKDFNASGRLEQMLEAGVSSFKIEGRLKDATYVKNVVAYYRQALDQIIAKFPEKYQRSSIGKSAYSFTPQLAKSFNRSFSSYFLDQRKPENAHSMASISTPKSMGEPIGKVLFAHGKTVRIATGQIISNGDGLSYFDQRGNYAGFRVNRVEGHDLILKESVAIPVGTMVYRTFDKAFEDVLSRPSAERKVAVDARLFYSSGMLNLELRDARGNRLIHSVESEAFEEAKTNQDERQIAVIGKLGNTIYTLRNAEVMGGKFIPSSLLTQLRRETVEKLSRAQLLTFERPKRLPEQLDAQCFAPSLTYADNVANHLSTELYRSHGVTDIQPALECEMPEGAPVVMHTRYCLRRELGACRLEKVARQLPEPLYLRNGGTLLQVHCDCKKCEMKITIAKQ